MTFLYMKYRTIYKKQPRTKRFNYKQENKYAGNNILIHLYTIYFKYIDFIKHIAMCDL